MHLPQYTQITGGGAAITQNQCRECDNLCPAGKKCTQVSDTPPYIPLSHPLHQTQYISYTIITHLRHPLTGFLSLIIPHLLLRDGRCSKGRWVLISLTLCQNMMYGVIASSLRWARCCCRERTPSWLSGPWQSSCKRQASTPEPVQRHTQKDDAARWKDRDFLH